ncbi:COG1086 Predicted nucleoside-diphosphate sugar epimerases [Burkholderiaceae bacterium]
MPRHVLSKLAVPVLALPRMAKRLVVLLVDLALCVLTVWLAYYLRLDEFVSLSGKPLLAVSVSIALAIPILTLFGVYRAIFRHSGWLALLGVGRAVGVYALLYISIFTAIGVTGIPRTIGIIQPILLLLFLSASRVTAHLWLRDPYESNEKAISPRKRTLIYGAGKAGRQLAGAVLGSLELKVVGFLDDDVNLHGKVLNSQVIYDPNNLASLIKRLSVSDVLLAMPSIGRARRNEILSTVSGIGVAVRTLPSLADLAQGKVGFSDILELDADDLLVRPPVLPDENLLAKNVAGKVVCVTGAGGSIGGEIARQVLAIGPAKLLLVEQSEYALYSIHQELLSRVEAQDTQLLPLLASVQNDQRMREIMTTWKPQTVYHAAAYKHVPLVEYNQIEGITNNLFGTLCTAQIAQECNVSDFVLISTDKAVRPTNVMGASKRLAEMTLQALNTTSPVTRFSMVRFGNVLGSSGSVLPKFRRQIRDGGPVTVTHPDITRYFMTIREAAQLVIQAGAMAEGGDVFVLDMAEPIKIIDLARRMVQMAGLQIKDDKNPNGDISIEFTGLRPGEKLFEELLIGDNPKSTRHPRIIKANENFIPWQQFEDHLSELKSMLQNGDTVAIRDVLKKLVVGYSPDEVIDDIVYVEREIQSAGKL